MAKVKEIFLIIIFAIINIILSFIITNLLGISNPIVFRLFSVMYGDITWEVIIFFIFSIVEAFIYECFKKKLDITYFYLI